MAIVTCSHCDHDFPYQGTDSEILCPRCVRYFDARTVLQIETVKGAISRELNAGAGMIFWLCMGAIALLVLLSAADRITELILNARRQAGR